MRRNPVRAVFQIMSVAGAVALAVPACAEVVTSGFHSSNNPFNQVILPGQYFKLEFGAAPFVSIMFSNLETGDVVSTFYVKPTPDTFDTFYGLEPITLSCTIAAGGSCSDSDFGVLMDLSEMGGTIMGSYTHPPGYNDCFAPGTTPVEGAICGVDYSFLPRMLLDVTFTGDNLRLPYTLTVSDQPFGGGGVPEPSIWAMLVTGFGVIGGAARRRKARVTAAIA